MVSRHGAACKSVHPGIRPDWPSIGPVRTSSLVSSFSAGSFPFHGLHVLKAGGPPRIESAARIAPTRSTLFAEGSADWPPRRSPSTWCGACRTRHTIRKRWRSSRSPSGSPHSPWNADHAASRHAVGETQPHAAAAQMVALSGLAPSSRSPPYIARSTREKVRWQEGPTGPKSTSLHSVQDL